MGQVEKRYGRLEILSYSHKDKNSNKFYKCKCDCGNVVTVRLCHMKNGHTKSCGCYQKEVVKKTNSKGNKYDLTGECGVGYFNNTNNVFLFDKEDFEKIKEFNWCESTQGYAYFIGKGKCIFLHKLITSTTAKQPIDHINRNKLDNRKQNLRKCTVQQNRFNVGLLRNNTSGYKGVHYIKKTNKWQAILYINYGYINLGYFTDKNDAIKIRKQAEERYFKEFRPI